MSISLTSNPCFLKRIAIRVEAVTQIFPLANDAEGVEQSKLAMCVPMALPSYPFSVGQPKTIPLNSNTCSFVLTQSSKNIGNIIMVQNNRLT
ncbi:hypothetical protein V6N11_046393 [Hibiscus sabdariffa]|uniref:Uncharacterized protein n=1 Tax=Hibiscus sabdariffa TaxID=183260 RepID=A0ABR2P2I4_9ROSI